jgi:serine/threonine-protein kinase
MTEQPTHQQRWERVQALFHSAVECPTPDVRAFLLSQAGGDEELVDEVLALLDEDRRGESLLDRGVGAAAQDVMAGAARFPVERFGPYRVQDILGEGGMGVVYLGQRDDLGSVAAIKILRDASLSPARRERFLNEQRTLAQLNHPAIAQLYDADTLPDGTPWFAMELVEGVPLTAYCRARGTSVPGQLELLRAVCEAVQHAHRHAVIHRDLKPSNILVKADGTVKLLDFGIAKHLEDLESPVDQTRTGLRLMTPAYAAPEQIRGGRVGIHTDVYALGVILYELLTGRLPFDLANRTPAEAVAIIAEREPEKPSAVARRDEATGPAARPVSRAAWTDLDVLCLTAMHKDPQRRYRTVEALIRDIDHFLNGEPLEARADTVGYRLGKFVRRHRAAVVAGTLSFALLLGMAIFYTVRLAQERTVAQAEAAKAQQVSEYLIGLFEASDPYTTDSSNVDAQVLLERGVERAETLADQPDVQSQMFDVLGRVYTTLSAYERGAPLLRRAIQLRRELPDHELETAESLANLGVLYRFAGQYDSAEVFLREALDLRERHVPANDASIATTLDALGVVLSNQGRYEEGETTYRRSLEIRRAIYADEPNVLLSHSLNNLGVNLANQGDYAGAERYLRESIEQGSEILGADHVSLTSDLANLGVVLEIQGNYAAADTALTEALRITRLRLGDSHSETAFRLAQLGGVLQRMGQSDRAEQYLRQALEIEGRVLSPTHRNTAITRIHLAGVLQDRGDLDGAEPLYRQAIAILEVSVGERHEYTATTRCRLAVLRQRQGQLDDAARMYRECIPMLAESLPDDHDILAGFRSRFGSLLALQRRFEEAEPLLLDSHEKFVARFGAEHRDTKASAQRVADLYDQWGKPEQAAEYRVNLPN